MTNITEKYPYVLSLLEALLVTFLWSSSYVLIKIGLVELPPLAFAATRYCLAFFILLAVGIVIGASEPRIKLGREEWSMLIVMGVAGYAVAQGLQFVGLFYLPAVTTTFLLNFTPIFVTLLGAVFLGETPTKIQLVGISIALVGAYVYSLTPIKLSEIFGVLAVLASGLAWAIYLVVARRFQRTSVLGTHRLTTITMGWGAIVLLVSAVLFEGIPKIGASGWVIIGWLSLVNTALAFYLWNHALRRLKAYEISVMQNTMLIQISLLAWVFLEERPTDNMIIGIILVLLGIALVQFRRSGSSRTISRPTS